MKDNNTGGEGNLKETARLEAFSDGVFAIAITLLILELIQILHQHTDKHLIEHLIEHLNSFFAFSIGFLTILICWINHHLVFTEIRKTDSNLMWVNGFVLLMVTFTPFPTSILSEYFETEKNIALAAFGFNYVMMALAAYCLTGYVYKKNLIDEDRREVVFHYKLLYKYSIVYNTLAFGVCFISVPLAIILYFFLFVVFAYPKEFAKKLQKKPKKKKPVLVEEAQT